MNIRTLIARKKKQLRSASYRSRDRIRQRLHVLVKVGQLRKERRA